MKAIGLPNPKLKVSRVHWQTCYKILQYAEQARKNVYNLYFGNK